MPIYEYECNACGSRFERRQRVSDDPVRECPACGGQTRRVLHPVGVIFKGSGFYCTDHRSGSTTSAIPPKDKADESKTETKAESKPEKKDESK